MYGVRSRKSKFERMRYEVREKILRFWKKLKLYIARHGKCRYNLDVWVRKERKDVHTPCVWSRNPR